MEDGTRDLKFIKMASGLVPTAGDMWAAVIVLLWAFDKPVRWYVWVLFALEKIVAFHSAHKWRKEHGND